MRPRPVCPARPATERRASRRSLAMLAHPAPLPPRSRCTHAPPVSRCTQPHGALGPDVLLMRGSPAVRAPWLAPGLPVFKLGPPLNDVDKGGAAEKLCRRCALRVLRRPPQRRPHVLCHTSNTHSGRRGPRDSPSQCVPHRRSTSPSSGGSPQTALACRRPWEHPAPRTGPGRTQPYPSYPLQPGAGPPGCGTPKRGDAPPPVASPCA